MRRLWERDFDWVFDLLKSRHWLDVFLLGGTSETCEFPALFALFLSELTDHSCCLSLSFPPPLNLDDSDLESSQASLREQPFRMASPERKGGGRSLEFTKLADATNGPGDVQRRLPRRLPTGAGGSSYRRSKGRRCAFQGTILFRMSRSVIQADVPFQVTVLSW